MGLSPDSIFDWLACPPPGDLGELHRSHLICAGPVSLVQKLSPRDSDGRPGLGMTEF